MNHTTDRNHLGESVGRNTAFALIAELLRAAFTAGLTIFLVRSLSPDGYGLYVVAMSVGILVLLPADFGISASASRYVAEHRGDPAAVAKITRDALRLKLAVAALLSIALGALAGTIAGAMDEPGLAWPLRVVAVVVFVQSIFQLCVAVFLGMAKNAFQARLYLTEGFVETSLAVTLVLLGGGAVGALAGRAAGFAVAAAAGLYFLKRLLRRSIVPRRRPGDHSRRIARYAGPLFLIEAAYTLFEQIDVLLLNAYLGSAAAGIFQAPLRLVTFVHLGGQAVSNSVAPRMARHRSEPGGTKALTAGLRGLMIFAAASTAGLVVWSEPIVRLTLGAEYDRSADVLAAIGPYIFLGAIGSLITASLNYLGIARSRIPIVIGTLVLQILLDVLLIPVLDEVGPAVATNIAYALYVAFHIRLLHRAVGLDLPALGATLLRAALAAAALGGVLALFGTEPDIGALSWIGGAACGTAAFAAVLLATGEVRLAEVRSLVAHARAWRP